jgi:hypothetical protein
MDCAAFVAILADPGRSPTTPISLANLRVVGMPL